MTDPSHRGGSAGRLRWVLWRDLLLFLADRNGVILTVITPIALALLFSFLFRPLTDPSQVSLLVVNQDDHRTSRALVGALLADQGLRVTVVDEPEARDRLARGLSPAALVLPAGAGRSLGIAGLLEGVAPRPLLLVDPSRQAEVEVARGVLARALLTEVAASVSMPGELQALRAAVERRLGAGAASSSGLALLTLIGEAERLAELVRMDPEALAPMGVLPDPTILATEPVGASGVAAGFDARSHNFAGMLTMFLLFLALERAKTLLDERQAGTLQRLRLAPVRKAALLAATGLGTAMIALLVSAVVYGVAMAFFGVAVRGSVPGFLAVLAAQALAVAGFALLLSGLGRTATQITNLGTFAILLMSFLGGATLPTFLMPHWVQSLSAFVPTYWATRGLAAMTWRGLPFAEAVAPALALVAFGLVLGTIGVRRFRWD